MSTHDHTAFVQGCYRCDLNLDEIGVAPLDLPALVSAEREADRLALVAAREEVARLKPFEAAYIRAQDKLDVVYDTIDAQGREGLTDSDAMVRIARALLDRP